ncbi:Transcription factor WhiB [uncultured Caudovirales phage]|uniref:Transcription factor WhiB n=1 Tax=uncultured Caudovirales phage TaxID=2100421 RepID=A0A6J5QE11_9CAUD|nr:Transcription factor WhiB [uncultured Caudovirales phage]CAB4220884.1 Transcription factor WhiB [uncultured Caudovirales phage]
MKIEITNAPCQQGVDPEIFFPDPTDVERIHQAKTLCGQCDPVTKNACLTFAITNSVQYGIFGGLTEQERNNLRRRENRKYKQYVSVIGEY